MRKTYLYAMFRGKEAKAVSVTADSLDHALMLLKQRYVGATFQYLGEDY